MNKKIFYNGIILTLDQKNTIANAVLVVNGIIEELIYESLSEVELRRKYGRADFFNLKKHTMLPGFIDAHSHITAAAYDFLFANASPSPKGNCNSISELISSLGKQFKAKKPRGNQWFIAMGYDESVYPNHQIPTCKDLDEISFTIPIVVMHASGHGAVLNSKALELCSIHAHTKCMEGGIIAHFTDSKEPTGLIQEQAFFKLVSPHIPRPTMRELLQAVEKAQNYYASFGITTAQDARTQKKEYDTLHLMSRLHRLKLDIVSYVDPNLADLVLPHNPTQIQYKHHYRTAGYKLFLDGSPQAKTAWLTKPYFKVPAHEASDYAGFATMSDAELLKHLKHCISNNYQVNIHVNGDAAIDQFIRCYTEAKNQCPQPFSLRPVAIHCQTVRPDQLAAIKECGILISFFLDHIYYWGDYHYESVLGPERATYISPAKDALACGINVTLHDDTPVAPPNMLLAIQNAMIRITRNGKLLGKKQRLTLTEALACVTKNAAFQIFEEDDKGTIEAGKKADFVVLSLNPYDVIPDKISEIKVLSTIKDGLVIYKKTK